MVSLRNSPGCRRTRSAGNTSTAPGPPSAGYSVFKPWSQIHQRQPAQDSHAVSSAAAAPPPILQHFLLSQQKDKVLSREPLGLHKEWQEGTLKVSAGPL